MRKKKQQGLLSQVIILVFLAIQTIKTSQFTKEVRIEYEVQKMDTKHFEVVEWEVHPMEHLEIRFFLHPQNTQKLENLAKRVSDPSSPDYMKYYGKDETLRLVAPKEEEQIHLIEYLRSNGITTTKNQGLWIETEGESGKYETILNCKFFKVKQKTISTNDVYVKVVNGTTYSLPISIAKIVRKVQQIGEFIPRIKITSTKNAHHASNLHQSITTNNQEIQKIVTQKDSPKSQHSVVIPPTLFNNYNISHTDVITKNATQCVAEFVNDHSYKDTDLHTFAEGVGIQDPNSVTNVGPYYPVPADADATLDIQQITSLGKNATNFFFTTSGWLLEYAEYLLESEEPPLVNSISWLAYEERQGLQSIEEINFTYMMLALRGITMIAASGNSGACGENCGSCSSHFYPGFPADSPWVLSVGVTQLIDDKIENFPSWDAPPVCGLTYTCARSGPENPASDGDFASGGGFAIFQPQPSYQSEVVSAYLEDEEIPKPPSSFFNASNRGFPDISSNAVNLMTYLNGRWESNPGSAAAPGVAGMIAMMNDFLANHNKQPVGFVTPLIYQMFQSHPLAFQQIGDLSTNNKAQCDYGFTSNPDGWDPVTGLGTLNFGQVIFYLTSILDSLPDVDV